MCQEIKLIFPDGKEKTFEPTNNCTCCLGDPKYPQINQQFAKWIKDEYQELRKIAQDYQPVLRISMF